MAWLFVLLAFLIVSSVYLYRFDGRRELMRFDLVQFLYAFVVLPLIYLWFKTFLFLLLKDQVQIALSLNDLFIIDTIVSLIFLFLSSFVVIHSLTKSFNLKREQDPMFDLHELSEYFHLTLSHFVIYGSGMLLLLLLALINIWVALPVTPSRTFFYSLLAFGVLVGACMYVSVANYRVATRNFRRIMKLFYGLGFTINVLTYLTFTPSFSAPYSVYWLTFTAFMTLVLMALFVEIEEKPDQNKLSYKLTLAKSRAYSLYIRKQLVKRIR